MADTKHAITLHATCVCVQDRGILILGASGSGKSSLALQLMALGARLVSDDRTILTPADAAVIATAPAPIAGLIEARGVGLIKVDAASSAKVALVVDLDQAETERLPQDHRHEVCGRDFPCLHHAPSPHFAAAILHYVAGGIGLRT